ncbi:LytTR family transcriptional regulator [Ancylobacter sp. A5.8]|uniref:LytTR family DNA-binding domain-containing protein n=1 Tax=Ancylobacter gelatini TaxID=2919920 RepID=UPI001F4D7BC6|nr:LytTR family DNA-binding domain-containing protein [Ancylobacter gelatini]MCJ8141471.1 LytTR family transcriptional regulator [Ancylobacter gelatini]
MREFAIFWDDAWFRLRSAEIVVALAVSPALAWIGPFDLVEGSFLARMGFWSGVLASWFVLVAVSEQLLARSPTVGALHSWPRRAVTLALAAVPMIGIVGGAIEALHGWHPSVAEVTELYCQILVLGSAFMPVGDRLVAPLVRSAQAAGRAEFEARHDSPALPAAADDALPSAGLTCPLILQLPPDIRGPLVCLEMQDHYVRVHTTHGSTLVLMRLRDAIARTQPVPGRQVHRSWWVADGAVERFERAGRTGMVQLSNGLRAPVSQRYLQQVAEALDVAASPLEEAAIGRENACA